MLLLLKVDEVPMRESMHAAAAATKSLQLCPTLCFIYSIHVIADGRLSDKHTHIQCEHI